MKITAVRCILLSAPYATPGDAERTIHLKSGYRPASFIRVETDEETMENIQRSLQGIVEQSEDAFSRVTVEGWDPELDARARILGAAQRLGIRLEDGKGWMIAGREPLNRHWIPTENSTPDEKRDLPPDTRQRTPTTQSWRSYRKGR